MKRGETTGATNEALAASEAVRSARRGPSKVGWLANGSRLSCGRPARRRKVGGRQSVPRQGHNTPFPLKRSPPASFKRLLGRQDDLRPEAKSDADGLRRFQFSAWV